MKKLLLTISSGILLILSFPPFALGFLAFVALIPLMFALDGGGKRKGLLFGLVFGFAFNLGAVYWVVHSMYYYGGVPMASGVFVMLLLVMYMSLYAGAFSFLFAALKDADGLLMVIMLPAIWVSLEYLRGHLFTGFPWVLAGYTQAQYPFLIQIADTTGVWGVSFMVVAANIALFMLFKHLLRKQGQLPLAPVVVALGLVVSVAAYGFLRISLVDKEIYGWTGLKAGIAQGSIDQGVKWDPSMEGETLKIYGDLTLKASNEGARFIVWPETAIPFYYEKEKVEKGPAGAAAKASMSFILTGSPSYTYNQAKQGMEYFNSAYLLSPDGVTIGKYDKIHLVPFGEYMPLRSILPFEKLTYGIGDFSEGKGPYPIRFGDIGVGMLICYESIFPEIARGAVRNGATVLVNITNDAWFGRTSAPYQHFDMAIFRAVENRSYLMRSANTGISAFIDPAGRIVKQLGLFERSAITEKIKFRKGSLSFYTAYGDVFAFGCIVMSGLFIIRNLLRRNG